MKYHYPFLYLFYILFLSIIPAPSFACNLYHSDSQDELTDTLDESYRFIGWAEEQIKQYEDSLLAALYPPVIMQYADSNLSRVIQPQEPNRNASAGITNNHVPNSVNLDYTKAVGEIPIISGTDKNGARTYEIPLQLSPGIAGHTPQLSLLYNSLCGYSSLGKGWYIGGLSSITRDKKTIYYDNAPVGIKMDETDAFVLDGVHLIKKNVVSNVISYESEIGNIQVKAYMNDHTLCYFEVFYPDGRKGVFGQSNETDNRLEYPIRSLADAFGNTISYEYNLYHNHYAISRVSYNGIYSVLFSYDQARPDSIQCYSGGLEITENRRLTNITCYTGTTMQRQYILSYSIQKGRSLLTQLDLIAGGASMNPLRFYYGEGLTISSYTSSNTTILGNYFSINDPKQFYSVQGKFEYNGNNDGLIVYPARDPYWKPVQNCIQNLYDSNQSILVYAGLSENSTITANTLTTGEGFINIFCADLTGDGYDCIVKVNNKVVDNSDQVVFKVYRPNLYGGLSLLYTRTYSFPTVFTDSSTGIQSIQPKYYSVGDFNGDGKMEILAIAAYRPLTGDTRPSKCYLFDLPNNQILYNANCTYFLRTLTGPAHQNIHANLINSDHCVVMDYDGDGKSDVLHVRGSWTDVYSFESSANGLQLVKKGMYYDLKRMQLGYSFSVCEFNGDGLMDILVGPAKGKNWYVYKSKGNGQFVKESLQGPWMTANNYAVMRDVNRDGLTDVVTVESNSFSTYINRNNYLRVDTAGTSFPSSNSILTPLDINGHNHSTTLISLKDNIVTKYAFSRDDNKEAMITGMANSLGVVEKNQYVLLPEQNLNSVSVSPYIPTFPYIATKDYAPVLQRTETFMNGGITTSADYYYSEASYHAQGLGYRGLAQIIRIGSDGSLLKQTFSPESYGALTQEFTHEDETTYSYSVNIQQNKIAKVLRTSAYKENLLTGLTASTAYTYDTYGYPLTENTTYSDGITVQKTTTYSHQTTVGNGYYMGFPTQQMTSTTQNGITVTDQMSIPSHEHCKPITIEYYKNGNPIKWEWYSYFNTGVPAYKLEQQYSSTCLVSAYSCDAQGHLTLEYNPLGFTTTYSYDANGLLSSKTDHRGNVTLYSYDPFGREVLTTLPDSTLKTRAFNWTTEGTNGLYSITQVQTGKPTTKTVYDAMNREVRTSDQRFDGQYRKIDKRYDSNGRLYQVSLPFRTGSPTAWNTYAYDSHNRLTAITEASGRETIYRYDGRAITEWKDEKMTNRLYDALGRVIYAYDDGGSVTYNLAPDGQPISITTSENIVTTFTYDNYRRRTSINDPSSGTTNYVYNSSGLLWKETNANDSTIVYTYDQYGRLTGKTYPEFSTTYIYNSMGDLASVTSTNGFSKEYTYDTHGRANTITESLNSLSLQKSYSYNNGNISSIQYNTSSGLSVKENYTYTNGHYKKGWIQKPNQNIVTLWELTEENDLGQTSKESTGIYTREYTYTSDGRPTNRNVTWRNYINPSNYNTVTVQDLSYEIDPYTNNILRRTDNTRALTDFFEYDELNRLSLSNTYNTCYSSYEYNGNIVEMSDMCFIEYNDLQKPYAVSDIFLLEDTIMNNVQTIDYTSFSRPANISEGGTSTNFTYNVDGERVYSYTSYPSGSHSTMYYFGGCYERALQPNQAEADRLYLLGDYYTAPAMYVKQDTTYVLYYILRDNLGSITHIMKEDGTVYDELSYDAWGRMRNPNTHELSSSAPKFNRGYTGHEHLSSFNLINMNARLYDPAIGRFLSPDPYIQSPYNSQNLNRYSYCLNNPLKYTDKSGELFIIDDWLWGGIKGLINGKNFWTSANQSAKNALRIWGGLFTLDSNKNFGKKLGELFSRFTWQLPQTIAGFSYANFMNAFYEINNIDYKYGTAVIASSYFNTGAITLGNFIIGGPELRGSLNNNTFKHEYGHYLQSQAYGWAYLLCVGIPSLKSAQNNDTQKYEKSHRNQPHEVDANQRSYEYFTSNYPDGPAWNSTIFPLDSELGTSVTPQWWQYPVGYLTGHTASPLSSIFNTFTPFIGVFF